MKLSRREIMQRIGRKDTKPEMIVRGLAHQLGFRFRLHDKRLPGSPDLAFPRRRKIVFVHGCFWHRHEGCKRASTPKTQVEFWLKKLGRNVERDHENYRDLLKLGWSVLTIWECETRDVECLKRRLKGFLSGE